MSRPAVWLAALAILLGFLTGSTPTGQGPEVVAAPIGTREGAPAANSWKYPVPYASSAQPVRIRIPALDVAARISPVGMSGPATMQVPADISVVGWFDRSVLPLSDTGTTVLVGHRDGVHDPDGVFRDLGRVRPGESIRVRDMSGRRTDYSVVDVRIISDDQFAHEAPDIFVTDGEHRLILITCGGIFDARRGGYQSNVVVTAQRT